MSRLPVILFVLCSCGGYSPRDYMAAAVKPENGRVVSAPSPPFVVEALWKDAEHVACERFGDGLALGDLVGLRASMSGMDLYELRIACAPASPGCFDGAAVDFMSFGLEAVISLEKGGVSHPPSFYHFERSGSSGRRAALVGFESGGAGGPARLMVGAPGGLVFAELPFGKHTTLKLSL